MENLFGEVGEEKATPPPQETTASRHFRSMALEMQKSIEKARKPYKNERRETRENKDRYAAKLEQIKTVFEYLYAGCFQYGLVDIALHRVRSYPVIYKLLFSLRWDDNWLPGDTALMQRDGVNAENFKLCQTQLRTRSQEWARTQKRS